MKGLILKIEKKVMENFTGLMENVIKECGKMEDNTEKVY